MPEGTPTTSKFQFSQARHGQRTRTTTLVSTYVPHYMSVRMRVPPHRRHDARRHKSHKKVLPCRLALGRSCAVRITRRRRLQREGMQVEVKNWHAVASWTWTTEDDVCGICHMPLDGCAPGAAGPGDDSPVVWGRVRARSTRFVPQIAVPTHR